MHRHNLTEADFSEGADLGRPLWVSALGRWRHQSLDFKTSLGSLFDKSAASQENRDCSRSGPAPKPLTDFPGGCCVLLQGVLESANVLTMGKMHILDPPLSFWL